MAPYHGRIVPARRFAKPDRVVECAAKARPEYHDIPAHEYKDRPDVLKAKITMLAGLLRQAHNCIAYTGAGLSVSSGLADYATKAQESIEARQIVDSRYLAQPNNGHKSLASLYKHGFVKRVFNQNHDGLLQKAGLPQAAVNEIHGAFFDPSNPGGFDLRCDLVEDMFHWANQTDLCLALGTSLSGLNADRMARTPAERYSPERVAAGLSDNAPSKGTLGLVIVNLQETQLDNLSTLRIFAELDDVMQLLTQELQLADVDTASLSLPSEVPDIFAGLPYNSVGELDKNMSATLDLRKDARIKVTRGNFASCLGVVTGKNAEGHFLLKVKMNIGGGLCIEEDLILASWFLVEAKNGTLPFIPLVQAA
jgi:NAD-dependent SIR2 family protein deacetylase